MRFPVFSSDHFMPQGQFYGSACPRPSSGRRGCRSSRMPIGCPFSSLPEGTAAATNFIPVMMMMGPRFKGEPRQHHPTRPSSQVPPFCASSAPPVISEAFNIAQGLLGELLGQSSCPSANAEKRGQPTSRQSSPSTSQGSSGKTSAASTSCKPSDAARTSSHGTSDTNQQRAASEDPPTFTQKMKGQRSEKTDSRCCHEIGSGDSQVWSHSLPLAGFAPTKVSAKVKNGKVHVHAVNEKMYGPGGCPCKLETIMLPENIDQKTLTCSMKQNSTLVFQALFKDNLSVKNKTEEGKMSADSTEKANAPDEIMLTNSTENEPQRKETVINSAEKTASADHGEEVVSLGSEEKGTITENLKSFEKMAERMDAPESKQETMNTSETKACDLLASKNTTEQAKTEDDTGDSLQKKSGKETVCYTDVMTEELTTEKVDKMDHHTGDEAQDTDTEQLKMKQTAPQAEVSEVEDDDDANQTTNDKDQDISFPIIEEPEDEPFSRPDDLLQNHKITQQSPTEDFVIIDNDSVSSGEINSGTGDDADINEEVILGLVSKDEEQTEEEAEEETAREISTSDETDPTRPIKRMNSQEMTQDSEANFTTPEEQSGTVSSHTGTFRASLPLVGFSPEDVHVNLQGHHLRIMAKRQAQLGEVSYTESVERELELPGHVDVLTVRCVYEQDNGCLIITADPPSQQRQVPVVFQ